MLVCCVENGEKKKKEISCVRPCPARFENTPYQFFGKTLYDKTLPDAQKVKSYDFGLPNGKAETLLEEDREEDFRSFEEPDVWGEDEVESDEDSANAPTL